MRGLFCAVLLTMSFAPAGLADLPLAAHLELVPNRTLPGIPVMFAITVTNPNIEPKPFYEYARLTVTDTHGATFSVRWAEIADGSLLTTTRTGEGTSHSTMIPKGGTVQYFVPIGEELMENGAFYDARLCAPGTYDLQMTLGQPDDAKTNVARLTVERPTGSDLAFWQAISATAGNSGLNASMWPAAGRLIQKYPDSKYYHLLAFHRVASEKPEDMIAPMKQALAAGVTGPIADEFRDQIAYSLERMAQAAAGRGDFRAAEAALDQAKEYVEKTIEHPSTEYARQRAGDVSLHLQATASDIERKRLHRGVGLWLAMKPTVQCREQDGRIRFGYVNPNQAVHLKVGRENHFDPDPSDRGQPVLFKSGGKHTFRVALLAGERSLSWVLDGATAAFLLDAPTTKKCDESDDEGDDEH